MTGLFDSLAFELQAFSLWLESLFQPGAASVGPVVYFSGGLMDPRTAQLSRNGLEQLKASEGWRSKAYQDSRGIWTIGYGHKLILGDGLNPSSVITPEQGEILLLRDVAAAVAAVRRTIKRPVSQNQFDAMVSMTYNIGAGGFAGSTVAKLFNLGDIAGAAYAWTRNWTTAGNNPTALLSRRTKERDLFLTA